MEKRQFLLVKEINKYIKNLLEGDSLLSNIWIKGEISNFKSHSSGHLYFNLKDEAGSIKCVMFRSRAQRLNFVPAHGMQVLAQGYISLYERDGQYQLYVENMLPAGTGALHIAYEQLKDRLKKEGLFNAERKRKLPYLPKKVAIVTSLTGAALRDILSILKRRYPSISVVISPAIVQGNEAADSICMALEDLYQLPEIDLIIVGRGGGSLEDLWCFNEEKVVRKIAESPVPTISAVGHETDFTLTDFVADIRAATPSMAAEIAVPEQEKLLTEIKDYQERLKNGVLKIINQERQRVSYLAENHILKDPQRLLVKYQQELDNFDNQLKILVRDFFKDERTKVNILINRLDTLSPLKTLTRGYSLTSKTNGKLIKSIHQVELKEEIIVNFHDGFVSCIVQRKKEKGNVGKID